MADTNGPDETGRTGPAPDGSGDDLERRRRDLGAALATRKPAKGAENEKGRSGSMAGFGQALKMSSEFVAGILVGALIGWFIDRVAGTAPWGLIIFLLLGFGAGMLNVLRSAGVVAEWGPKAPKGDRDRKDLE